MRQKMTDEALRMMRARQESRLLSEDEREMWDHIDVVTAERDEETARAEHARERVRVLEAEVERVRGVVGEYRDLVRDARRQRTEAESRLAAMRQRAGELEQQVAYWMNLRLPPETIAEHIRALLGLSPDSPDRTPGVGVPAPPDAARGLYSKYLVQRADGSSAPGGKHHGCPIFVLDLRHDAHARGALAAYVSSCESEFPALASDLRDLLGGVGHDSRPGPTTAEAFATVRGALHSFLGLIRIHYANRTECDGSMERGCLSGLGALSLLERRMGAMATEVDLLVSDLYYERFATAEERAKDLQNLLTDAPPVFTLEEVERVLAPITVPSHPDICENVKDAVRDGFAALRK